MHTCRTHGNQTISRINSYIPHLICSGILVTMKSNGRTRNKGTPLFPFPVSSVPSFKIKPSSSLLFAHVCIAFVLISSIVAAAEEDVIRSRVKRRGK